MTVTIETNRVRYSGNGTSYAVTFPFFDTDEITVIRADAAGTETTLTETTEYSVSGGSGSTGTVTTVTSYSDGYITIIRNEPLTQETDWQNNGALTLENLETNLDRVVMIGQKLQEQVTRALKFKTSLDVPNIDPTVPVTASKVIGWNSDGDGLTLYSTTTLTTLDMIYLSAYASLSAAITANPSKTIIIDADADIDADTTVPSTSPLWFINEAKLSVASTKTLTLNCPILADSVIIVTDKSGAGTVAGNPVVPYIDSTWFDTSGGLTDSTGTTGINAVTLITPTIASFTNATHDHADAAGGGALTTVVQAVQNETAAVSTTTTNLPWDDTIPQNTEGSELLTQAITPTNASNKLVIEALINVAGSAADPISAAIFQDTTANALNAASVYPDTAGKNYQIRMIHEMAAGTTSATTFKLRVGPNNGATSTVSINGAGGARKFGGVYYSTLRITEIRV